MFRVMGKERTHILLNGAANQSCGEMILHGLAQAAFVKEAGCELPFTEYTYLTAARAESINQPDMLAISNAALGCYVRQSLAVTNLAQTIREKGKGQASSSSSSKPAPAF